MVLITTAALLCSSLLVPYFCVGSEYSDFSDKIYGTGIPLIVYQRKRKAPKPGRDSARASAVASRTVDTMSDGAIADLVTVETVKGEASLTWGGRFAARVTDKTQGWGYSDVQAQAEKHARGAMASGLVSNMSGDVEVASVHAKLQRTQSARVGGKALRIRDVLRVVVRLAPPHSQAVAHPPPRTALCCHASRALAPLTHSIVCLFDPPLQVGTLGSEEASWPEHVESLSSETRFSLIGINASQQGERNMLTLEAASVGERAVLVRVPSSAPPSCAMR